MANKRVLVVGLGNMGMSHALAYTRIPGLEVVGVCTRHIDKVKLPEALAKAKKFSSYDEALKALKPDIVSINTLPDTHADYAIKAMEAGAHVFVEKPLADNVANAEKVVDTARRTGKKLVVGYILRQHPSWIRFIEIARQLGTPLVFRMNLNQQSNGQTWEWHKRLMDSFPPIVDCGVHYVDVMCQMTKAKPVRVQAMGAHLSKEVKEYNYGILQVAFDDGSVGWYEARLGADDERDCVFREGRDRPEGLGVDRHGGEFRRGEVRRHQRPRQDQPDPVASRRHVEAGRAHRHDRRARP